MDLHASDETQLRHRLVEFGVDHGLEPRPNLLGPLNGSFGLHDGHAVAVWRVSASSFFCASISIPYNRAALSPRIFFFAVSDS
jgi:hypothetical protein